ncbi:MAG: succinate dehydrogenase, cytochrome b556 subunit [bacterium]
MMYKWRTGAIAWLLHRLSGLALAAYLPMHIWVNHHLAQGPESYNRTMSVLASPLFRTLEIGLWAAILYHALNGLRVVAIDLGPGVGLKAQKILFYAVVVLVFIFWVWGSVGLLGPVFERGA